MFAVLAASFNDCKTLLENLSLDTSRGASAVAADEAFAPSVVKSLDCLKSPKYEETCKGV
jgi:hypothetical protein